MSTRASIQAKFPSAWVCAAPSDSSSTYAVHTEQPLHEPDARFDGTFSWLPPMEAAVQRMMEPYWIDNEDRDTIAEGFEPAVEAALASAYELPEAFLRFMRSEDLRRRVPSPTACYFDAPERIVRAPSPGDGILFRFLNDQQWCAHWYLYVERGGAHAVVTSRFAFDVDLIPGEEGDAIEAVVYECAPDFERFIHRMWFEGTAWLASVNKHRPLTDAESRYLAQFARS